MHDDNSKLKEISKNIYDVSAEMERRFGTVGTPHREKAIEEGWSEYQDFCKACKSKAVILYILKKCKEKQSIDILSKKLFIIQRTYLVKYGRGILYESFHAYKEYPYPSLLLCLKKQVKGNDATKYFNEDPDMDELAQAEIEIIDEELNKLNKLTEKELNNLIFQDHAFKCYFNNLKCGEKISILKIAESGGATKGILEYIQETNITF